VNVNDLGSLRFFGVIVYTYNFCLSLKIIVIPYNKVLTLAYEK
jgi:hypothetical protein